MKVYIVIENLESMGSMPRDMDRIVHGIFLDQKRAEDFVRGMLGYIHRYEGRRLLLVDGKARDENHVIYFQILSRDIYG